VEETADDGAYCSGARRRVASYQCRVPTNDGRTTLKIVQLSDLHYAPGLEADRGLALAERVIRRIDPDLIVVSGDLTQAGLFEHFVPVVQFLEGLGLEKVLAIPGNRDYLGGGPSPARPGGSDFDYFLIAPDTPEPLDDPYALDPHATPFTDFFEDIEFFHRATDVAIVGLDSEPMIRDESFRRGLAFLESTSPKSHRIFCTHRSLLPVPRKKLKEGDVLQNAGDILAALLAARVDVVMLAHLHRVHAWQLSDGDHTMVLVNAPSLLDVSPGKENGLLLYELGKRGTVQVSFHPAGEATPRVLIETSGKRKQKRRSS
jgi:predicted phosphodiesterase